MTAQLSRRELLLGALAGIGCMAFARPSGVLVDTHIHLFAPDQKRFPYHPLAPYKPEASSLEDYVKFARQARIDHTIIIHPEPYQDDHSYLEYCLENEPSRGFFKGTCLFDPIAPDTPQRMSALAKKYPGRIVSLRIHAMQPANTPPSADGAIRNRDLKHPGMKATWKAAHQSGINIQVQFIPVHAPELAALAAEFRDTPVVMDHLARYGSGTPAQFEEVLKMAKLPRVFMKYSGVSDASKDSAKPIVRRVYDAFGPDRILWGGLGSSMEQFDRNVAIFDEVFDFAPESERAKIRGLNAMKLFGFS
ncbi:MAG: amidohydrolase [Candidatus Korobacteraceae bacterium]